MLETLRSLIGRWQSMFRKREEGELALLFLKSTVMYTVLQFIKKMDPVLITVSLLLIFGRGVASRWQNNLEVNLNAC